MRTTRMLNLAGMVAVGFALYLAPSLVGLRASQLTVGPIVLDTNDIGGVVGRGGGVRLVGGVGDRLVGTGSAGVVGLRNPGRSGCGHVGGLPVVGLAAALWLV